MNQYPHQQIPNQEAQPTLDNLPNTEMFNIIGAAALQQVPKKGSSTKTQEEVSETSTTNTSTEKGEKIKSDLDALLDEIDGVLEENAEEFVRQYIQKGGQ